MQQRACPGCSKRSFRTCKQCRHCQKPTLLQWQKDIEDTTGMQLLAKHEYKKQREDFQNRKQREDNDKERLGVDQIQQQW